MNKFCGSALTKAFAWFFHVLTLLMTVLSGIGIMILLESGAFFDDGISLLADTYEDVCFSGARDVLNYQMALDSSNYMSQIQVDTLAQALSPDYSNLRWRVSDSNGKELNSTMDGSAIGSVCTRRVYGETVETESKVFSRYSDGVSYVESFKETATVVDSVFDLVTDPDTDKSSYVFRVSYLVNREYIVEIAVVNERTKIDRAYYELGAVELLVRYSYQMIALLVISALTLLAVSVFLLCCAGHRKGTADIHIGPLARVPYDLLLSILGIAFPLSVLETDGVLLAFLLVIWFLLAFPILYSFAARVKTPGWWKNSLILRLLRLLWRGVRALGSAIGRIGLFPRTAILLLLIALSEIVFLYPFREDYSAVFWILEKLLLSALAVKFVLDLRKLEKGGHEIARGNVSYKVMLPSVLPVLRRHAADLNNISDGLDRALAERMKSERMKAELITNVSHDIKTPLTSIVNYVDLLKREGLTSENAPEYLSALDRQSQRLKKLTEDLIEASKASSGSLTVNAEKTDLNIVLDQSLGEYSDKFRDREINVVFTRGDTAPVLADGGLLWRVFDNLLSNILKYTQPGTRAYISSVTEGGRVYVVMRNISKDALNITPDELTERFVRGDVSRSSEGSGLGLSIAKNITELMGGEFRIEIDGDLFKATVSFPLLPCNS